MPTARWFLLVFSIGTFAALGVSLLSPRLRGWAWSSRVGCSLAGAAMGTLASAMLVLSYPSLAEGLVGHAVSVAISAIFGFAIQKSVNEGRLPIPPFE